MALDPKSCYRAVLARDARHDGRFFTCVKTTRIYCRPICPARPPKLENCTFVPTAAAAQSAGYRPCLRCRPESSPDLDAWRGASATVSRALKLIESGALDEDGDVSSLAARLDIGERHLRRLFQEHIGAAPVTVAQTRRLLLAKQLIHQTDLPMIDVAMAAGFGSVRRFNETFQQLYHRPPSELRRRPARAANSPQISLSLPYHPPYDWPAMIRFLHARAIPGLEYVTTDSYSRVIDLDGRIGSITIFHDPDHSALRAVIRFPDISVLSTIISRIRRMFDLSAEPASIAVVLSADPLLGPLVERHPGLRLPGAWDPFEIAVRAILGQQITIKSATQLAGQLTSALGATIAGHPNLTHAFPHPADLTVQTLAALRIPKSRAIALAALASAARSDPHLFDSRRDLDDAIAHLRTLPGIGPWTANYIAMRALGETDAFLEGDVVLQRALTARLSPSQLLTRAEAWRPWRAYGVLHLWNAGTKQTKLPYRKDRRHALAA